MKSKGKIITIVFKSKKGQQLYYYNIHNKSDNFKKRNGGAKQFYWNKAAHTIAITLKGAVEKSLILLSQY